MTFANGNTISVQWGPGNYCENYNLGPDAWDAPRKTESWESKDAEIACWKSSGEWITREMAKRLGKEIDDDVIGRLSPDEVLAYIIETAKEKVICASYSKT